MQVAIRVPYFLSNYCTRAGDMLTLSQSAGKSVELCNFQIVLSKALVTHFMIAY